MIGVMTTASTKPEAAAADAQRAAARVASEALAAQLVRQAAARWPTTSDQVTILGRELAGSIDRYEQVHHQTPPCSHRYRWSRTSGRTNRPGGGWHSGNS
jgi:hypothetical protein